MLKKESQENFDDVNDNIDYDSLEKISSNKQEIKIENFFVRWYKYNKRKIPMFISIIAIILFTGFLDVNGDKIKLASHFSAISNLTTGNRLGNFASLDIFLLFVLSLIQFIIFMKYSKTGQLILPILSTVLCLIQIVLVGLYFLAFFNQQYVLFFQTPPQNSYNISDYPAAILSMTVFGIGLLFSIISTTFSWFYINPNYVKEKE